MTNSHTLISLFAGAGGLDIGLEQAGFVTRAINELEPHACESLRQNKLLSELDSSEFDSWFIERIGQKCYVKTSSSQLKRLRERLMRAVGTHTFLSEASILEGDIRKVSGSELLRAANLAVGQVTLVAGGPPCQPFSRAGKRETVNVDDGRLFLEFVRVVKETRPRWFLFENVKGLAQSRTLVPYFRCGSCNTRSIYPFSKRATAIESSGINLPCPRCNSFGIEITVRDVRGGSLEIILGEFESIGYLCRHSILNAADFGVPQSRERLFIVGSRDHEGFNWPRPSHREPKPLRRSVGGISPDQLSLLSREDDVIAPWRTVADVLWKNGHPEFGPIDRETAVLWVKNVVRPHAEPVSWTLDRPSPTVGAHQAAKLAFAPSGVPESQLARQQWHTKGRRQRDLPPVFVRHEYLSDEELLMLQTFPEGWYLHGTRMERAFQIGNAVPPLLAKAVGKAILEASGVSERVEKRVESKETV